VKIARTSLPGEDVTANNTNLLLKMTAQLSLTSNLRVSCVLLAAQANCVKVSTKDQNMGTETEKRET
jgi:hypothetical protein